MLRKTIILVMTLAAIVTTVVWFNQIGRAGFTVFPDKHFVGFAMIYHQPIGSVRLLNYSDYPSVAVPVEFPAYRQYNCLVIPLWSVLIVFWCYPITALLRRARRRRYVEHRWFAVAAGMLASAIALHAILFVLLPSGIDRLFGSDEAAIVVLLLILILVPAICAIVVHNRIAGPLRRASLRQRGMCVDCGYDLTGNESGVCPECGSKIEQP